MAQCTGKCYDCERVNSGEIQDIDSCAIQHTQSRTFIMSQKINNLEKLLLQSIEENKEKKGKKSIPVKLDDNSINPEKIENND